MRFAAKCPRNPEKNDFFQKKSIKECLAEECEEFFEEILQKFLLESLDYHL